MRPLQHHRRLSPFGAIAGLVSLAVLISIAGLLLLFFKQQQPPSPQTEPLSCDHTIGPEVIKADGRDNYAAVGPGDTVCVEGGIRSTLKLRNFQGTADQPIIFINSGAPVIIEGSRKDYAGIDFRNSEHIRLTGTGLSSQCGANYPANEQQCGFVVKNSARGVAGIDRTRHIEIDHVEVHNSEKMGFTIKSKHNNGVTRSGWTQYNTYLHHNYLHDIGTEGFYIGSSFYQKGLDPLLEGVDISHNLILRTGWDGLQVGSAIKNCAIHHNRILEASQANNPSQRSGIMNNRGSVCDIYDNYIADSVSRGIYIQGNGGNRVSNNVIVRPGRQETDKGDGIVVTSGSNQGRSIFIWNNTIIEPKRSGIRFRNEQGNENLIQNNIIIAPGALSENGDAAYIDIKKLTNVTVSNNLLAPSVARGGLSNSETGDYYSLLPDFPAVDSGADFSHQEVMTWPYNNAQNNEN